MINALLKIEIGIDPTLVDIGGIEVTWHGVFTAIGVIVGVAIAAWLARRMGYSEDMVYNAALALVIGGIIGARGLYVIENWSEVGGDDRPIVRLSRETNSGTHVYFLENVLRQGDSDSGILFSTDTLLLPSSEGIIRETSQNPNCIGYDGLGYVTDEVKVIRVAADPGEVYITPSVETVNTGEYPIARELYMYTNGVPQGELADYMTWIFSAEAQQIVAELGFVPVENP